MIVRRVLQRTCLPAFVTGRSMALERRNGQTYYYRSRRQGGRVVKEYVGAGKVAEVLARGDELLRHERAQEHDRERTKLADLEDLIAPVKELEEAAEVLTRAHLIAAGCHRYKGEWRRARSA